MSRLPFKAEYGEPLAIHYDVGERRFVTYVGVQVLYAQATGRSNSDGTPEVLFKFQQTMTTEEVVSTTFEAS